MCSDFLPLMFVGSDSHRAHPGPFKNQIETLVFSHFVIDFQPNARDRAASTKI